jgi:metal-responsive CopG/Arc/MetJ family transcriptional regulator
MIEIHQNEGRPKMPGAAKPRPSTTRKIIVDFPDALYVETQKAVQELSIKRSAFIRDAVREYLHRLARRKLARELAEGYRANSALNRQISEEFIHVDADNL